MPVYKRDSVREDPKVKGGWAFWREAELESNQTFAYSVAGLRLVDKDAIEEWLKEQGVRFHLRSVTWFHLCSVLYEGLAIFTNCETVAIACDLRWGIHGDNTL